MVSYSESVLIIRKYEEEYHISPEEVAREQLSENHLRTLVVPEDDREHILESAPIDSPEAIVTGISI